MCIRDSNTIIKEEVELALNLKQTPEQALQNIYDKGSEPVSYTHLDVYKRQT